jgi:hypothetical protein
LAASSTLAQSLLAFQAEGVKLQKDSINPHFKNRYIGLDSLMADVLPVLNKCGLVVLQMPTESEGGPALTTRIVHAETGDSIESTMPLLMTKQDPQAQGAALTYARRYALMAFLGLVADEDTDGHTPARKTAQGNAGKAGAAAAKEAPTAAPATNVKTISEAQAGRLYAIASSHAVPKEEAKRIIFEITGAETSLGIPSSKYDEVVAAVEAWTP